MSWRSCEGELADVDGCVHIRVVGVVAVHAGEGRLVLAVLLRRVTAGRAALGRVGRVDGDHDYGRWGAVKVDRGGGLGFEPGPEQTPGLGVDGSVQAALLGDVGAGLVDGASSGPDHVHDGEVFDGDEVVVADQGGGGLLDPVLASVDLTGREAGEGVLGGGPTVRALGLAGEASLQPTPPGPFGRCQEVAHAEAVAVGGGGGGSDAEVDAHDGAGRGSDHCRLGCGERHVPASSPVQRDPSRSGRGDLCPRPGEPEPHRTELRHQHRRPSAVHPHDGQVPDGEPLMDAGLAPRRTGEVPGVGPPVLERTLQIPQRRLLYHR